MDDLRTIWTTHADQLARHLRLNERALRTTIVDRTATTMSRYASWGWLQLGLAAFGILANGTFLVGHLGDTPYLLSSIALQLYLTLHLGLAIYRLVLVHGIDYAASVTAMQRAIERVKIVEYHGFKWALLLGVMLWVPALAVLVKGLLGVDFYAEVSSPWVIANVVFGLVVLLAGQLLARRFVERPGMSAFARSLVDNLSGYRLRRASRFLDELAAFENDESAA